MVNEVEKKVDSNKTKDSPKKTFPLRKIGLVFLILLFAALLSGEGFFYYYLAKSQTQLTTVVNQLQTEQQKMATIDVEKNLTSASQAIQQLQADVKQLQQTSMQATQSQQMNKNKLEWMQASYYVKLANDNLQYVNNIPVAVNLLKMADDTVRDLSDARYDDIRKALANDIASLQSAPNVDVTGLYLRLTALNTQLDQLQLPNKLFATEKPAEANTTPSDQSWWQRGLQNTWQALQKIVVIRYDEKNTQPFITPEQQLFLYQNVHAMLAQAIWGLLHGQTAIYQGGLKQTSDWVKKYFVADSSVTHATLNELDELQKIDIHPTNPTIMDSLQAFKKLDESNE